VGDPEKIIDLATLQAEAAANQKARREARGYESAFSEQAKRFKREREEQLKQWKSKRSDKTKEEKPKGPSEDTPKFDGVTIKPKIVLTRMPWTHPDFMLIVERTLLHLKDASAGIYQRGNTLVRLIDEWAKGMKGERVKVWKLVGMTDKTLEIKMMKYIDWDKKLRVKGKQDEADKIVEVASTPIGSKIASYALEMRGDWPFPTVEGVISAPTMRPNGTLLNDLGYDRETGLMLINSPEVKINPRPSRDEAEASIELLRDLYVETAFKNEGARGVALSLDLSTVLCGAIPNTPLYIIRAPKGASGKTYIVQIACVMATGVKCVPMGRTKNAEEFEKRLSSLFMEGRQLIFLDNHNDILQSDLICQAVTGDKVLIRKFGVLGENIEVSTRAVIAATGNGISIAEDLDRRTLLIELDTGLEKPQFKKYRKPAPLDLILADRAKYIRAALTIPLAYIAAGCPVVSNKQVLDFEDWERLVRFPLIWLGEKDPLITMDAASDTDIARRTARAMRFAIKTVCGVGEPNAHFAEYIINAIIDPFSNAPDLKAKLDTPIGLSENAKAWREVLMTVAGVSWEPSPKKLGQWFNKNKDIIDDGLVIRGKLDPHTAMNVWWVEEG
jgi:putative DNA primase/helicase